MAHDTLMLIAQLSGLRINVLANRFGCDTNLARGIHTRLADVLAAMIEDQRKVLTAEGMLAMACATADEEDAFFDLHHYHSAFYEKWLVEPVALLDDYLVDDLTREYFDFREARWFFCDGVLPIAEPVEADKLCGLATIIAEIEDITGARFSVDHVYYSEAEAEAAWWERTGHDPIRSSEQGMPASPEAERSGR